MKIKIKVTKEILERSKMCGLKIGERMETNCAIALAVREVFPNAFVEAHKMFPFTRMYDAIELPAYASEFIGEFDFSTPNQRIAMQPISFDIEVPDAVIERIGIGQVYKILSESKTLEYVGGER